MIVLTLVLGALLGLAIFVIVCLALTLREAWDRCSDLNAANVRFAEVNKDYQSVIMANTKFMEDANEEWFTRCEDYRQRLETELRGDKDA
jgi:hypothetical protein